MGFNQGLEVNYCSSVAGFEASSIILNRMWAQQEASGGHGGGGLDGRFWEDCKLGTLQLSGCVATAMFFMVYNPSSICILLTRFLTNLQMDSFLGLFKKQWFGTWLWIFAI